MTTRENASPRATRRLAATLLASTCLWIAPACEADQRTRIAESSLENLNDSNDSARVSIHSTPSSAENALSGERVRLENPPPPTADVAVHRTIQSGLHRLKRETALEQIDDSRKAQVNDTLSRAQKKP